MHRTTASRPTGAPAGQKQPGEEEAQAKQAEAAARAEGQSDRAGRDNDQPNTPPDRQTSHQTRPEAEIRQATANIKAPPFTRMREGREPARGRDTRHVLPSLAGAPAGKAPACGRLLPPCAGLALALPAGATAGTPARRRRSPRPAARECARRRHLRRQCARRYKLRAPAGARPQAAGRGPAWPLEAARAAAPLRRAASA